MKLNNDQYNVLKQLAENLINLDLVNKKKDIAYGEIFKYIKKAVKFSELTIDEDDYNKLFTEIEYGYKIVHTEDQVIFNDYDNQRDWYHREDINPTCSCLVTLC